MTDKPAAMYGTYRHLEFKPGLKVARVWIEIPIEKSAEFIKLFGTPDLADPKPMAIALIKDSKITPQGEDGPATEGSGVVIPPSEQGGEVRDSRKSFRDMPRSQQAALKCQDEEFQIWLAKTYEISWDSFYYVLNATSRSTANMVVKDILGIASKRELDKDEEAAKRWDALLTSFDMRHYRS